MSNWAVLALVAWSVFVYCMGYTDGKLAEQENRLVEGFDRIIEKVRLRLSGK